MKNTVVSNIKNVVLLFSIRFQYVSRRFYDTLLRGDKNESKIR